MNIVRLLGLPWVAISKRWREGIGVCFALLFGVVAIAIAFKWHDANDTLQLMHVMAILDCLFWTSVLSQSLLLAREAHRLRLPTLGREVIASLTLYALLSITLPAALLAWLGAPAGVALTEIALGAGIGMAYATLPTYLGIFVCFAPMLDSDAGSWLPMPAASPDGFIAWAAPCTLAVWLLIAYCWRRSVQHDSGLSGTRKPIILNLRTQAWYGRGRANNMEAEMIRRRVRWLQPVAELRHCGPGHAVRSLRIAMGGWFMPLTPTSRLRQLGTLLAGAALPLLVMAIFSHGDSFKFMRNVFGRTTLAMFVLGIFSGALALGTVQVLQNRWKRPNAELPLLALLPGLGNGTQVKLALLQASLLPALGMQALLMLVMLGCAAALCLDAGSFAVLLLGPLTSAAMLVAFALTTLGGVRIGDRREFVLAQLGYLLICLSTVLALPLFSSQPPIRHPAVALIATIAWATLFALLLRLAQRGWRGLEQRPHPFLPNV